VVGLAGGFAVLEAVTGLAPTYATFFLLLIPTGLLAISFATSANPFVQLGSDPQMRGRVISLYMLMFMGGTPVGAPFIGWLAERAGARWSLIAGGLITLACIALAASLLRPRASDEAAARAAYELHAPQVPVDTENGLVEDEAGLTGSKA
jgi:MFS family permease